MADPALLPPCHPHQRKQGGVDDRRPEHREARAHGFRMDARPFSRAAGARHPCSREGAGTFVSPCLVMPVCGLKDPGSAGGRWTGHFHRKRGLPAGCAISSECVDGLRDGVGALGVQAARSGVTDQRLRATTISSRCAHWYCGHWWASRSYVSKLSSTK